MNRMIIATVVLIVLNASPGTQTGLNIVSASQLTSTYDRVTDAAPGYCHVVGPTKYAVNSVRALCELPSLNPLCTPTNQRTTPMSTLLPSGAENTIPKCTPIDSQSFRYPNNYGVMYS